MEPGKEGGTWLALSLKGKAGVILNLSSATDSADVMKKGRGSLITNFITSDSTPESYLNELHKENQCNQSYNPYNLVLLNLHNGNVHYLTSALKSEGPVLCSDNVLGFGNSGLEVPYKKVEGGKEMFRNIIENAKVERQEELIEELIKFLKSKKRFLPDPELHRRNPINYEGLSSIFVSVGDYSTRTHSILLVNGRNEVTFIEESRMPDLTWKRQYFNANLIDQNHH